ncbi:MAG: hypothetical protein GXO00_02915 [Candidatus Diapherotrites archaeon]|nr:hypothetical protein [Candidatus Diapherotrites archaeon]
MKSEEYVRGRLEGLFQLVSLLKEVVNEEEAKSSIVQRLVEHIYTEIEEILEYLGEEVHHEVKKKIEVVKQTPNVEEKVAASYDVLSELIQKKTEG